MRKFLATLFLVLLPIAAHAQQENRASLVNTYNTQLPTNGHELITAQDLRGVLYTLTNSITAIFGDNNVIPNNVLAQVPGLSVKANIGSVTDNLADVPLASFFGSAPDNSIPSSAIFGLLPGGSISSFVPANSYLAFSVTSTSARQSLPTPLVNTTINVYNTGTKVAYAAMGDGSIVATTGSDPIQPGSWISFGTGTNTFIALITGGSDTTSVTVSAGAGLAAGSGGGTSGGAGGTVTLGAGTASVGTVGLNAGTNVIGHVIADTGSTTAVTALPALPTGTNVIGHVINDAGSAVIGHVIADTGSTTAVTALPALPAGSNVIGHVICDSGCGGTSTDGATFSFGSSAFMPTGGTYNSSIPALADGKQGTFALSNNRSLHVLDDNSSTINSTLSAIQANTAAAIPAGANSIGTVGLNSGANVIGKVQIDQGTPGTTNAVQPVPGTTGGLTSFFLQPTASDNHTNIKNGAGTVYHVMVTNNSATVNYLRFYNAATGFNGCNSATNLVYQAAIPASTSGTSLVQDISMGLNFSTGISICVTSGYATTDTTSATATAMSLLVGYK